MYKYSFFCGGIRSTCVFELFYAESIDIFHDLTKFDALSACMLFSKMLKYKKES